MKTQSLNSSHLLTAFAIAATLAGCANSPIPLAQNFELTSQYKVRSAGHWDLVSKDVVGQTAATLDKAGVGSAPVYVSLPAKPSAFDQGFREFLITKMVQGGKQVLTTPNPQALEVSYQTQVVRHNSPRPHFIPGGFTMLAGGLRDERCLLGRASGLFIGARRTTHSHHMTQTKPAKTNHCSV